MYGKTVINTTYTPKANHADSDFSVGDKRATNTSSLVVSPRKKIRRTTASITDPAKRNLDPARIGKQVDTPAPRSVPNLAELLSTQNLHGRTYSLVKQALDQSLQSPNIDANGRLITADFITSLKASLSSLFHLPEQEIRFQTFAQQLASSDESQPDVAMLYFSLAALEYCHANVGSQTDDEYAHLHDVAVAFLEFHLSDRADRMHRRVSGLHSDLSRRLTTLGEQVKSVAHSIAHVCRSAQEHELEDSHSPSFQAFTEHNKALVRADRSYSRASSYRDMSLYLDVLGEYRRFLFDNVPQNGSQEEGRKHRLKPRLESLNAMARVKSELTRLEKLNAREQVMRYSMTELRHSIELTQINHTDQSILDEFCDRAQTTLVMHKRLPFFFAHRLASDGGGQTRTTSNTHYTSCLIKKLNNDRYLIVVMDSLKDADNYTKCKVNRDELDLVLKNIATLYYSQHIDLSGRLLMDQTPESSILEGVSVHPKTGTARHLIQQGTQCGIQSAINVFGKPMRAVLNTERSESAAEKACEITSEKTKQSLGQDTSAPAQKTAKSRQTDLTFKAVSDQSRELRSIAEIASYVGDTFSDLDTQRDFRYWCSRQPEDTLPALLLDFVRNTVDQRKGDIGELIDRWIFSEDFTFANLEEDARKIHSDSRGGPVYIKKTLSSKLLVYGAAYYKPDTESVLPSSGVRVDSVANRGGKRVSIAFRQWFDQEICAIKEKPLAKRTQTEKRVLEAIGKAFSAGALLPDILMSFNNLGDVKSYTDTLKLPETRKEDKNIQRFYQSILNIADHPQSKHLVQDFVLNHVRCQVAMNKQTRRAFEKYNQISSNMIYHQLKTRDKYDLARWLSVQLVTQQDLIINALNDYLKNVCERVSTECAGLTLEKKKKIEFFATKMRDLF